MCQSRVSFHTACHASYSDVVLNVPEDPQNPNGEIEPESKSYYSFRNDSRGFLAYNSEFTLTLIPGENNTFTSTNDLSSLGRVGPQGDLSILWKK